MPLVLTTLLAAVLGTFLWAAMYEVERTVLEAGGARALAAATQLSNAISQGTARSLVEMRRLAADAALRQYLLAPADDLGRQVQQRLRSLVVDGQPFPVVLDEAGARLLTIEGPTAPDLPPRPGPPSGRPRHTGAGPFEVVDGVLYSDTVVEVRDLPDDDATQEPGRLLGYLVGRRIVRSAPGSAIVARLVGDGASLALGNRAGDVWTDFARQRANPPVDAQRAHVASYDDAARKTWIGGMSPIEGTPWAIWVEFPRAQILAPARAVLRRLVLIALLFIFASALVITTLSRRVTRPLHDLTEASEAIAGGRFSRQVVTDRQDEIGRLGTAFNVMADRVAESQRELEARVQERTAALTETRAQLEQQVAELQKSRAELDQFFALSPDMLCIADMEGRFLRVNSAWQEVLGWSAEELTAEPYAAFVHPDDRGATTAESAKLADGQTTRRFENRYRCRDGSYRVLSWRAAPVVSRGLVYGAARDVTERRAIERELEQRAEQLTALNAELEAFSYSVSHDLRAPLRHISGFVGLLKSTAASKLSDEENRRLHTITEAANRMGRLIDDLLAFSRMGRTSLAKRPVSLGELVDDVRRELSSDLNGRQVAWKVSELPSVDGDPSMLRLVLVNLMSNAVKYSRMREDAVIEIGERPGSDGEVVVFVRDNGVGFDMEYADKLFGVFQRLHRPDDFEGTGIGLANVRRIVSRHGGRTWAEGTVGAGATFYFSLPRG